MAYWAATQLQKNRERVAEHFLKQFGFEVYLPRVRRYFVRFHKRIETLRPYFPNYCFTRIELQWHGVRECPGVIRLVRIGGDQPVHVPDEVATRAAATRTGGQQPWRRLKSATRW